MNHITASFAALPVWAAWRPLPDGRKLPVTADGKAASIADPATWATLSKACLWHPRGQGGLVIALTPELRLLAIDFDNVVDGDRITCVEAARFAEAAKSYCEISPSGRGLHVWLRLEAFWRPERTRYGCAEVYAERRFMSVSGQHTRVEAGRLTDGAWALRTVSVAEAKRLSAMLGYAEPAAAPARPAAAAGLGKLTAAQLAGLLANLAAKREGYRNEALYWTANRLREAGVPHYDAEALLLPVAAATGLPEREAQRTIASAYGARRAAA